MAKSLDTKSSKTEKQPGQLRQLFSQYVLTAKKDKLAPVLAIGLGLVTISVIASFGLISTNLDPLGSALWCIAAVVAGVSVAGIIMTRRSTAVIYSQYANEMGRVSLVIGNITRKTYKGSNQPIAIQRPDNMVFRAIGPAGVVLIGEGSATKTRGMLEDEKRKVQRVAPGAHIETIYCSENGDGIALAKLHNHVLKLKRKMNRAEIAVVNSRLSSLGMNLPIPKGIDPNKARAGRKL
jgi:hypothetical protein